MNQPVTVSSENVCCCWGWDGDVADLETRRSRASNCTSISTAFRRGMLGLSHPDFSSGHGRRK